MRRDHGSSPLGLAAMPAVLQQDCVRLLRPLLGTWRADLRAWLQARGERWIEDPSNLAERFERVRQRAVLARSGAAPDLAAAAARFGLARDAEDRAVARLLATAAIWHPEGYMTVALDPWRAAGAELRRAALRRMLMAVGGHAYPPGPEALATLAATEPTATHRSTLGTLSGCILAARQGRLTLCREAGDIRDIQSVVPGWAGSWDNRFALSVDPELAPDQAANGLSIRPLGADGQRQAALVHGLSLRRHPVPEAARAALPALWRQEQVLAQPHLGLGRGLTARPAPRHSVTTCGFTVALAPPHTIYSSVPG
jgi:tRNA(Ile)-lysidine synthase